MAHDASARKSADIAACRRLDSEEISQVLMTGAAKRLAVRETSDSNRKNKGYGLCETTFPSTGEQKGLVILVEYQDVKFGSKNRSNMSLRQIFRF